MRSKYKQSIKYSLKFVRKKRAASNSELESEILLAPAYPMNSLNFQKNGLIRGGGQVAAKNVGQANGGKLKNDHSEVV